MERAVKILISSTQWKKRHRMKLGSAIYSTVMDKLITFLYAFCTVVKIPLSHGGKIDIPGGGTRLLSYLKRTLTTACKRMRNTCPGT